MKKRSFSYKALLSNKISQADLEKLATAGMLTDATLARLMHIGRFRWSHRRGDARSSKS